MASVLQVIDFLIVEFDNDSKMPDDIKEEEKQAVDTLCGDIIYPSATLANSILKYRNNDGDNDKNMLDENVLHSTDADVEVTLIFANESDQDLYLYWINYDGDIRIPASLIKSNGKHSTHSFITHPFIVSLNKNLENFKDIIAVYIPRNISHAIHDIIINKTATILRCKPGTATIFDKSQRKIWTVQSYEKYVINGFTVYFEVGLMDKYCGLCHVLNEDLNKINNLIPCAALKILHSTPIWLNDNYLYYDYKLETKDGKSYIKDIYKPRESMCFHPDINWLIEHGNVSAKRECVEIYRVKDWIKERGFMPMVLLHELSHAYHWYLDYNRKDVLNAYNSIKNSANGLYRNIAFILGGKRDAYALTNQMEYFAELSESYYGLNDFYPFNRDELKQYDEIGYQLMQNVWNFNDKQIWLNHKNALENRRNDTEQEKEKEKGKINDTQLLEADISRIVSV